MFHFQVHQNYCNQTEVANVKLLKKNEDFFWIKVNTALSVKVIKTAKK